MKRIGASLQLRLSVSLALAILLVGALAGGLAFRAALEEAHELQDDTLRQVALLFDRQPLPPSAAQADAPQDSDEDSRVLVQLLGEPHPAARALPLPPGLADGLHTLEIQGETYRALVRGSAAGQRIAVLQPTELRDEIAREGALRALVPLLVLVPVLLLVVAHLVRKMFRPIAVLSREIDRRADDALHPVDEAPLPLEVRPFAVAINRMLGRVEQSMQVQRRFVADAAHELRSPLTALSLQAERLAEADMSAPARDRLAALRQGIARGRRLLDQLLGLARAQAPAQSVPREGARPASVQQVFREVLEDLMPLAEARGIDIGVEGEQDALVRLDAFELAAVIRNLVDNAVRYTPEGGQVDLSVRLASGRAVLCVEDSGPGIAPGERERVFDPFYRVPGSSQSGAGLGLSIVRTLLARIGGDIDLAYRDEAAATGLRVRLVLPLA
ncbi:sensor histidine kinase [Xylophilus rhododendri]|nr:ATP-binding protein [Xylophilus rhododendri]